MDNIRRRKKTTKLDWGLRNETFVGTVDPSSQHARDLRFLESHVPLPEPKPIRHTPNGKHKKLTDYREW